MKDHHFEKLIRAAAQEVTLPSERRERMRSVISEYMAFKPRVLPPARVESTFFIESLFVLMRRPALAGVMTVAVFALTSGGVAYAAEGALPGDTLYPVKVAVTEPLRTALAGTPGAKAEWQIALAERRINEAATLAKEERLPEETETALATQAAAHIDVAAQTIALQTGVDEEDARVSSNRFATRLIAYGQVLSELDRAKRKDSTKNLREAIESRIALAETAAESAPETARTMAFSISASAPAEEPTRPARVATASRLKEAADTALHESAAVIGTNEDELDEDVVRTVRKELKKAEAFAQKGRERLEANDEDGASEAFEASLRTATRLGVLTKAAATFKINPFEEDRAVRGKLAPQDRADLPEETERIDQKETEDDSATTSPVRADNEDERETRNDDTHEEDVDESSDFPRFLKLPIEFRRDR